jgi:hypothetical protein
MLLLLKLRSTESSEEQLTNITNTQPITEGRLCDSLTDMGFEESSSNREMTVIDVSDI